MNKIYEINKKMLKKKYEDIYNKLCIGDSETSSEIVTNVYEDNIILGKNNNNRIYWFGSNYNNKVFSKRICDKIGEIKQHQIIFIIGMGNFDIIKEVMGKLKDNSLIFIYEPDVEIFKCIASKIDLSELINDEKVFIYIKDINIKFCVDFMECVLNSANSSLIKIFCMPNYDILYKDDYINFIEKIRGKIEKIIINRNTVMVSRYDSIRSSLYTVRDVSEQYSVNQLIDICKKKCDYEKIPAIVVSAGPSLNKNIEKLKKAQNKAVIIAVDSALKTVLSHGINPDIIITIDWEKPPMLFMHSNFFDIPMVVFDTSNMKIMDIHRGKRFYFSNGNTFVGECYKKVKKEVMPGLGTGGSVANNAFSLAMEMGFENIILIGQDLAYTNNEMHAKEAWGGIDDDKVFDTSDYIEVEDVYGGKVYESKDMELYRIWFEQQIVRFSNLNVIDATEGGAKINGSTIMTLSDAIDKYCLGEFCLSDEIKMIEKVFNEREREEYLQLIKDIDKNLDKWERNLKKLLLKYDKLLKMHRNFKSNTKEYKKLIKEIGKWTTKIEEDGLLELVGKYNRYSEYELLARVYDVKEDEKDEIEDIVNNGKTMVDSYIKAISRLKEDMVKFDEFDVNEFEELIKQVCDSNDILRGCKTDIEVNDVMKNLYTYLVDLIHIAKKSTMEDINNIIENLQKVIEKIVELHERGQYLEMAECVDKEYITLCERIRS